MSASEKLDFDIRVLESLEDMETIEDVQRRAWGEADVDIVPAHLLVAAAHNGGLVAGAFHKDELIGFVLGFLGTYDHPEGWRLKHWSHMLGVNPEYQNMGIGFKLKRAQWQLVRNQGIDLITWTYDPLISKNAYFNLTKLGGVCNTYYRNVYGALIPNLEIEYPSDRFRIDLWVNTKRVEQRMSLQPRKKLDMAHFHAAGTEVINPTDLTDSGFAAPTTDSLFLSDKHKKYPNILMVEIPSDIDSLFKNDPQLGFEWRNHTRGIFEDLFSRHYLVTDFVFLSGQYDRSFYVLTQGESTLGV